MGLAIVTGSSSGLGSAVAVELIEKGFEVVGISRSQNLGLASATRFHEINQDLGNIDRIPELSRMIIRRFGVPDFLALNAASGFDGTFATMHDSEVLSAINLNLVSPLLLAKYLGRQMVTRGSGSIAIVSSVAASTAYSGLTAYSAAKGGLISASRVLAREYGTRGVRVNCVSPGFMETSMTQKMASSALEKIRRRVPSGKLVSISQAAALVCFLASESSSGINGANLTVDLGSTA